MTELDYQREVFYFEKRHTEKVLKGIIFAILALIIFSVGVSTGASSLKDIQRLEAKGGVDSYTVLLTAKGF